MAHRRNQPAAGPDLRALLAAHYLERAARQPERTDAGYGNGSFFVSPWRRLAERLEAGEAIELGGWEIKKWRPDLDAGGRYRLEPSGSVVAIPWNTNSRRRSR